MKNRTLVYTLGAVMMLLSSCGSRSFTLREGDSIPIRGTYTDFTASGEFCGDADAYATLSFGDRGSGEGYQVLFHGGPIDGTIKSGSLLHVRNLYRSLAQDEQWSTFELTVRGQNISIKIGGVEVVCYTEPSEPFRTEEHKDQLLGEGSIHFDGLGGETHFRNVKVSKASGKADILQPIDEQTDRTIRAQQVDFPVVDFHVHLKGGLTTEMAWAQSMNYGINYGVAPNAGEGGVGRMLADDAECYAYYDEVKDLPFLRGVQGEGRRWMGTFSKEALGIFDYLFTDAMTIIDQKGRNSRIYRSEEVLPDGLGDEQYMDVIVDQTVKILTNEPADIYANATYLPEYLQPKYDELWTDERINRVLDVLQSKGIALEISARYCIPSERIVRMAHERGIKFTFGTNNIDADFGRLEYCLDMASKVGLSAEDMWWPSMSTRKERVEAISD